MGRPSVAFEAIGTRWHIRLEEPLGNAEWTALRRRITDRIEMFDKTYSRFRDDSLVTRIAHTAGDYELPPDGYELLQFYEDLYRVTGGKVTPLIGQVMADIGYDATYSFEIHKLVQSPPAWEDVLSYGPGKISVKEPVLLDFGAAGKGYLVDIIGELIEQTGISSYTIDASGDIRHRSTQNVLLDVGLENPLDTSEVIGIVKLGNSSLCASAGSKRRWGGYHHIIDPTELRSPTRVIATWVLADDTMTADGLATALFFTNLAELRKHYSFSYALIDESEGMRYAKDFPATLFEATV